MAHNNIDPLRVPDFQLAEHSYRRHNAVVPGSLEKEDLTNPALWVNVSNRINMGDEIRCVADDYSFVAYLFCTHRVGNKAVLRLMSGFTLDTVGESAPDDDFDYEHKLRGPKKWCIVEKSTGKVVKEGISTEAEALRELEDFRKALAA